MPKMTKNPYQQAFEQSQVDLANAIKERDEWTIEVARLQQVVKSLASMVEKSPKVTAIADEADEVGLQDVVHSCVRSCPTPLSATDVRDRLLATGYGLSRYSNPLAVIHGALKRLAQANRIQETSGGKYQVSYFWEALASGSAASQRSPHSVPEAMFRKTPEQRKTVGQHMAERGAEEFKPKLGKTVMPKN